MLTSQQTKILEFICKSIESEGFAPTLREIGDATGLSTTRVRGDLMKMDGMGFIKRTKCCSRAIKVLRRPSKLKSVA